LAKDGKIVRQPLIGIRNYARMARGLSEGALEIMKYGLVILALAASGGAATAADVLPPRSSAGLQAGTVAGIQLERLLYRRDGRLGWSDQGTVNGVVATGADIKAALPAARSDSTIRRPAACSSSAWKPTLHGRTSTAQKRSLG